MNEQDRELFMLLGSVGIPISNIATGLIYHTLSHDEQVAFSNHLKAPAEGFRHQALQIPIVVKENPA